MKSDLIFVIERKYNYILINIESLNVEIISKKEIYINGKINPKINYLIETPSFVNTLIPKQDNEFIEPHIITSFNCNYSCTYCYQQDQKRKSKIMTPLDIQKIKLFYDEYCNFYNIPKKFGIINIVGGEPFLPENEETIMAISQNWSDNILSFTTNGSYLNYYSSFIQQHKIRIKLSLDGTKEMHYRRRITREKDAYENTIASLNMLIDNDVDTNIITLFNPKWWKEYPQFFDEMVQLGWLKSSKLTIGFIPQFGRGCDDISKESIENNIEAFFKLKQIDSRADKIDARKLYTGSNNLITSLYQSRTSKTYDPYRCSCLSKPSYSFLPDGTVHFCISAINDQSLIGRYKPIIEIDHKKVETLKKRRFDQMEKCRLCNYKVFCKGGCVITAIEKTGQIDGLYCSIWDNPLFIKSFDQIL